AMAERLQPQLEATGLQTVARLAAGLEQELGSRLDRASQILAQLQTGTAAGEQELKNRQIYVEKISEQVAQTALDRVQSSIGNFEHALEEAGRGVVAKLLGEIETKGNDTTHTTFESLYKTAEWYEKKVQTQMQASLDRGIEQGSQILREKAGELSTVFAAELDRYSRNYVEHTRGQLDETARENLERVNRESAESLNASAERVRRETSHHAETTLHEFRRNADVALGQVTAQIESYAAQVRADVDAETQRRQTEFRSALTEMAEESAKKAGQDLMFQEELSKASLRMETQNQEKQLRDALATLETQAQRASADYRTSLEQERQEALEKARRELDAHAEFSQNTLRVESQTQEKHLREAAARANDEAMAEYKKRLENASNSWLLSTVTKLTQHSEEHAAALTQSTEQRMRTACNEVFSAVGETLRRRLLDVTATEPA